MKYVLKGEDNGDLNEGTSASATAVSNPIKLRNLPRPTNTKSKLKKKETKAEKVKAMKDKPVKAVESKKRKMEDKLKKSFESKVPGVKKSKSGRILKTQGHRYA